MYNVNPSNAEWHFVINQVKHVEELIEKRELAYYGDDTATIGLLARYYRNYIGYPKEYCVELILEHLEEYSKTKLGLPYFDNGDVIEVIEKACDARRHKGCQGYKTLRDFDGIWITQKEIDTIRGLEDVEDQELMFSILCFTKMYNEQNRRNNRKVNNLFYTKTNVLRRTIWWKKGTSDKIEAKLIEYYDKGLLGLVKNHDKYEQYVGTRQPMYTHQCLIVDDEGEGVIYVNNFDTLHLLWAKINGEKYIKQCPCGKYFKTIRGKYCIACGGTPFKAPKPRIVQGRRSAGPPKKY